MTHPSCKPKRNHSSLIERLEGRELFSAAVASTPFGAGPVVVGKTIEAENFDNGGSGVAWHVVGKSNPANCAYRANTAVGVQPGGSNGYDVGYTSAGEWLNYTIDVSTAGKYILSAAVACIYSGAQFTATFAGGAATAPIAVPDNGSWTSFKTVTSGAISLPAGVYVMRINIVRASSNPYTAGNYDYFKLTAAPTPPPPAAPSFNWKSAAAAPVAQFEGQGRVVNGLLYTFGGYTRVDPEAETSQYQVYNPATNAWKVLGQMPAPTTDWGCVTDSSGDIIFIGGLRGGDDGTVSNQVWKYATATNAWSQLPSLPIALAEPSAALDNGVLHVMGGNYADRDEDGTQHFELNLNALAAGTSATWKTDAPLPAMRDHAAAEVVNSLIYLLGGEIKANDTITPQTTSYCNNPAANTWTTIAPCPVAESHEDSASFVVDGKILLFGGQIAGQKSTNAVLEYDPAVNQWRQLPNLPGILQGTIVQPDGNGNQIIMTGGYVGNTLFATNATWLGTLPTL